MAYDFTEKEIKKIKEFFAYHLGDEDNIKHPYDWSDYVTFKSILNKLTPPEKLQAEALKEGVIAGVDFTEPLDSLASITGVKLSDMLGKKND